MIWNFLVYFMFCCSFSCTYLYCLCVFFILPWKLEVGFAGPRMVLKSEELLPYLTLRRC